MYSIGLDISKSSVNVYIPLNKLDLVINNDVKSFKALYSKLKKIYKKSKLEIKDLVFVFESTGSYSVLLNKFCANNNIKVFMINPKASSNFAKAVSQRNKSDVVDARVLSKAIDIAREKEIHIPVINPVVEYMREMISYYKIKVKQRIMSSNHLEALTSKYDKGGNDNKTIDNETTNNKTSYKINNSFLTDTISQEIKDYKEQEKGIMESIYNTIQKDNNLKRKYECIISIPGLGKVVTINLIHLFIKYPKANAKQIVSLSGLDPIIRESGTSIRGKSRISKAGASIYRDSLFMAAMVAVRHNDKMKVFYQRLKDNGKHTTVAQVAVMRKLIVVAFSLYKQGVEYSEDRYISDCGIEIKESDNQDVVKDNKDNNKIDTICHNENVQQIEEKVDEKKDVEKKDKRNIRSKNKRNRKKEIGLSA